MDKKQLSEMIRRLHAEKLEEIIGKPTNFNPSHRDTHMDDPTSPNHPKNMKTEARTPIFSGGAQGKSSLGNLSKRFAAQKARGRMNQKRRYLNQIRENDGIELGPTDTGKKGQESEKINVNPSDTSTRDQTSKNTTVKETKEK